MSLNSTRSRLATLTKQLSLRWQETRELFNRVNDATTSIEDLEAILTRIRRDCD
jgi:septal ring factor EnvC (AmiA/AmiB activator)